MRNCVVVTQSIEFKCHSITLKELNQQKTIHNFDRNVLRRRI